MYGVTFDDDPQVTPQLREYHKPPYFVWMLVTRGYAKSIDHAYYILIGFIAVCVVGAFLISSFFGKPREFKSDPFPPGYMNDPDYLSKYGKN